MLIEQILPPARQRLVTIPSHAFVTEAAEMMLNPENDLLVVCRAGVMAGVVTKTDIVAQVRRHPLGFGFQVPVDTIMTREVASCRVGDRLNDVWLMMSERHLRRIPILDTIDRPIGIVNIRDALQEFLAEAEIEEKYLRDYISGIGYH